MPLVQILRDQLVNALPGSLANRLTLPWTHLSSRRGPSRRPQKRAVALLLGLALAVLTGCSLVEDQLNLVPKPPSPEIKRLAQSTTMTPLAQRLFYRQDPTVEPPSVFWEQCQVPHGNIVLGCYFEERKNGLRKSSKIVIQNVVDHRFAGTMEVTAAHEMLHAAYARLASQEQVSLFKQLHQARKLVTDPQLRGLLSDYESQSKERYAHELYAHLGTELADFENPELEAHYQQFFSDRQQVVAFAEQSSAVVAKLEEQADALETEISKLEQQLIKGKKSIDKVETRLNQLSIALEEQQRKLRKSQSEARSASSKSKAKHLAAKVKREQLAFNRKVENYNRQVKQQKKSIARFNKLVQDYGQKVETYNQLAWRRWKTMEGLASQAVS